MPVQGLKLSAPSLQENISSRNYKDPNLLKENKKFIQDSVLALSGSDFSEKQITKILKILQKALQQAEIVYSSYCKFSFLN